MASNYEDVLGQLVGAGLQVDSLEVGRLRRCKVEGSDREKRGWYHLHEIRLPTGDDLIVGSYGVWRGAENHATKVELRKSELSTEQRESLRKRLAEDKRRSELARKADAARAAERATKAWKGCTEQGDCEYLHRKGVRGHGVRFSPQGAVVIPMQDVAGNILGRSFAADGTVLSGHGGIPGTPVQHIPQIGIPHNHMVVPEGVRIRMYGAEGDTILDSLGNQIERQMRWPFRPPTVDVYGPGDVIPEHVLYPPTPDLDIINNPVTVSTATSLADLITPNGGTYDWAACRNYPLLP